MEAIETPSPGTRVKSKLRNFLSSKMAKNKLGDEPRTAGHEPSEEGLDSPSMRILKNELEEEKRKRALIAQEAAQTEEVVRNV